MKKHVFLALLIAGISAQSVAADSPQAAKMTLVTFNGNQAELLQPVALNKQTDRVAKKRVNIAAHALNEKLSRQLEEKFAKDLSEWVL